MRKKLLTSITTSFLIFSFTVFSVGTVLAQDPPATGAGGGPSTGGQNQIFPNPLGSTTSYLDVVTNVIQVVLGVVGVVALVVFIYGGIVWMTSLGNSERVKQGRDTLIWASLGLIVVFASFAIVNLILGAFAGA